MRPVDVQKRKRPQHVDAGPAPMLQWLPIDKLVIDDSFQRELLKGNWKAIERIAAQFKWSRFSPVFVAPAEGGLFSVIDGQHRTHAAAICGFAEVPCQIVQMSPQEQAASFAAVNGLVTKVQPGQIFKAARQAGAEWAVQIDDVARSAGCKLMTSNAADFAKKPREIFGIHKFRSLVDEYGAAPVSAALKLVADSEAFGGQRELWAMQILTPMLRAMCQMPRVLALPDFAERLDDLDIWELIDRIDFQFRQERARNHKQKPKAVVLEHALLNWLDRLAATEKAA